MTEKQNTARHAHLRLLSTEQLEQLLRADFAAEEQDANEAVVSAILALLEERDGWQAKAVPPDCTKALAALRRNYDSAEEGEALYPLTAQELAALAGEGAALQALPPSKQPERLPRPLRRAARMGVILSASILVLLVSAQAAGFDLLGAFGRWSEETFRFSSSEQQTEKNNVQANPEADSLSETQKLLLSIGLPKNLEPQWFPERFQFFESKLLETPLSQEISVTLLSDSGDMCLVKFDFLGAGNTVGNARYEKDKGFIKTFSHNDRLFYIISNQKGLSAVHVQNSLKIMIAGSMTVEEMEGIINSIGEER